MCRLFATAILLSLFAAPARANEECWNSERTFYNCSAGGGAKAGASAPLIGDTLESNPAALPTAPTPFGIEAAYNDRSSPHKKPKVSFSTVKGFEAMGFGVGSWSDGTFTAPDFPQHFLGTEQEQNFLAYQNNPRSVLGLRIGGTILLPKGPLPKGIRFSVGASAGFGRVAGEWAPQVGVLMMLFGIGLGYSQSYEHLSALLPRNIIHTGSAGFHLGKIYLGYTYSEIRSRVKRSFANTGSLRLSLGKWILHGAAKFQKDHRGASDSWHRAGIQRRFGALGLGYEYGTYRYSHGAVVQLYF